MSTFRVTQRLLTERSFTAMQAAGQRVSRVQEQLSTGRVINRPSDSPTGTNSAMRLREEIAAGTQYARNASDGLAWLGRTDNTLTSMVDNTRRARDLILQGSNGALGDQAQRALGAEINQIREGLLSLANTQHMGRPLFGGTSTKTAPYAKASDGTVSFTAERPGPVDPLVPTGAQKPVHVERQVADGVNVRISTLGPEALELDADTDIFSVLKSAADKLATGNAGDLSTELGELDAVMKKMMTELADVGTRYGRVEKAQTAAQNAEIDMTAMLSEVENVDIAKAIIDLQMQEVAYQAALGATARVIQPSLLDFLR